MSMYWADPLAMRTEHAYRTERLRAAWGIPLRSHRRDGLDAGPEPLPSAPHPPRTTRARARAA